MAKTNRLIIVTVLIGLNFAWLWYRRSNNNHQFLTLPDDATHTQIDCSLLTHNLNDARYVQCIHSHLKLKSVQVLTDKYPLWDGTSDSQLGHEPFSHCTLETRCYAFRYTTTSQQALPQSDAVVVHMPYLVSLPPNGYQRPPKQIWYMFTLEPPRYAYCRLENRLDEIDDWFNLSRTIKTQSYGMYDLNRLYRYEFLVFFYMKNRGGNPRPAERYAKKQKLALWFVSRCVTPNRRERYVAELIRHGVSVDIFGRNRCGNYSDPCRNLQHDAAKQVACYHRLYNSYKFYIAFENANCDGYISEKYAFSFSNIMDSVRVMEQI